MRTLALLLLLQVCPVQAQPKCEVDPRLVPHLNSWLRDVQSAGIQVDGLLHGLRRIDVTPERSHAGESDRWAGHVLVSEEMLERGPWSTRAALYHELGHWAFQLDHGSCRLMATGSYYESTYAREWAKMVKEYLNICSKR